MGMVRYPLPITNAMLAVANPNFDKPRYTSGTDWSGGAPGNPEDQATACSSIVDAGMTGAVGPYAPKNQSQKAAAMVPPLQIVDDLGKDYGPYTGLAGRPGIIGPKDPYPDATSPPYVGSVTPATGLAAGGTAVTISGAGFTGATGVTFGGTAATAVAVVNANTITCTSPVHAAGTVDVQVTSPRGPSAIVGTADNFVYT
jgi:hypothetical protein